MTIESHGHEHEFEPQYGLPERLPQDEKILWQGSPDWVTLARRGFHLYKVAAYFGLMLAWRAGSHLADGAGVVDALFSLRWLLPLAIAGLFSIGLLAWLTARTTVYTLTDKRVVMRVGIALTVTFNLPLRTLAGASLRRHEGDFGDICLALAGQDRIAYVHLWPSVRPWHFKRPEPMLRAVPNAQEVAAQLQHAWSAVTGVPATPVGPAAVAPAAGSRWQESPT